MDLYHELMRNKDFRIWIWKNRVCSLALAAICTYAVFNYSDNVMILLIFVLCDILCIVIILYLFKRAKEIEVCINKSDAVLERTILIENTQTGVEEMVKLPKIISYHTPLKGEEVLVVRDYKRGFGNVAVYRYKTE